MQERLIILTIINLLKFWRQKRKQKIMNRLDSLKTWAMNLWLTKRCLWAKMVRRKNISSILEWMPIIKIKTTQIIIKVISMRLGKITNKKLKL